MKQFKVAVPKEERKTGYLYEICSGVCLGPASDEQKALYPPFDEFNLAIGGCPHKVFIYFEEASTIKPAISTIEYWALIFDLANKGCRIIGNIRKGGGRETTGIVVKTDGMTVTTNSGTKYNLGEPDPTYVSFLKRFGKTINPENPLTTLLDEGVSNLPKVRTRKR